MIAKLRTVFLISHIPDREVQKIVCTVKVTLVLRCASLLRTIFASLVCAQERVHVQNVRDFPQTKLDGKMNSPFLINEHGDPQIFFQVFAKNSLIKSIFEEEKKFDSGT